MNRGCKMLLGLFLLSATGVDADVIVEQPSRAFGYFIGDVFEQRIRMESSGLELELVKLPTSERVGPWLYRLSSTLVDDELGRRWLELKYQVINTATELKAISLPALELAVADGIPLAINSWPISISPLTPAALPADTAATLMLPDRQPVLVDSNLAARRLNLTGLALAATLALWLGWWFWRRNADAIRLPFTRAWHDLRKLNTSLLDEEPDAWFILHRAFNDSAGRTVSRATIDELIKQQDWLETFESRIADFYVASATRFFEHEAQPRPLELIELGRDLYLAEKRHAGGSRQARR